MPKLHDIHVVTQGGTGIRITNAPADLDMQRIFVDAKDGTGIDIEMAIQHPAIQALPKEKRNKVIQALQSLSKGSGKIVAQEAFRAVLGSFGF